MPVARLILVAHAATTATRRAAFGSGDELAEPASLAAAVALARVLPAPAEALASPAPAAAATAAALRLEVRADPQLRDLDSGCWTGRALTDIDPSDLAAWLTDPDYAGHGGESIATLVRRIETVLAASLGTRGTTIAVTHAAVLRAALVATLAAPASAFWRVDVAPLSALALSGDGRRWMLRALGPLPASLKASGE